MISHTCVRYGCHKDIAKLGVEVLLHGQTATRGQSVASSFLLHKDWMVNTVFGTYERKLLQAASLQARCSEGNSLVNASSLNLL